MVAFNRLKEPWSIDKQREAEQWLRDNPPPLEVSGYCRGIVVGIIYGIAIGVILQSALWR